MFLSRRLFALACSSAGRAPLGPIGRCVAPTARFAFAVQSGLLAWYHLLNQSLCSHSHSLHHMLESLRALNARVFFYDLGAFSLQFDCHRSGCSLSRLRVLEIACALHRCVLSATRLALGDALHCCSLALGSAPGACCVAVLTPSSVLHDCWNSLSRPQACADDLSRTRHVV